MFDPEIADEDANILIEDFLDEEWRNYEDNEDEEELIDNV